MTKEQNNKLNKAFVWSGISILPCWLIGVIGGNKELWIVPVFICIGLIIAGYALGGENTEG